MSDLEVLSALHSFRSIYCVCWNLALCVFVSKYQRLCGNILLYCDIFRQHVPLKIWYPHTNPHCITSQKELNFTVTTIRAKYLTLHSSFHFLSSLLLLKLFLFFSSWTIWISSYNWNFYISVCCPLSMCLFTYLWPNIVTRPTSEAADSTTHLHKQGNIKYSHIKAASSRYTLLPVSRCADLLDPEQSTRDALHKHDGS